MINLRKDSPLFGLLFLCLLFIGCQEQPEPAKLFVLGQGTGINKTTLWVDDIDAAIKIYRDTLRCFDYQNTAIIDEGVLVWAQMGFPVRSGS
ncbi:hypothetical protein [Gilvibacter sp.]|uniref:hypothetical protein n=1 Tax=Gilvibacter sp. TaxID=2729997 RepID=UPI0025C6EF87|nr:hypothetical protein [Gilvibacter sp.]NQX78424.1 hypothetical protein [Gilvibacter sp.]